MATAASEVDLDAFGVDLGMGVPVSGFQIRDSDAECCREYRIYSLDKTPRLLRTIRGGESYSASDVDLDGRVEIWTNDAAAVNGFEKLTLGELDSAPPLVLRLERGQLIDVTAEFRSHFDEEIRKIRDEIPAKDLEEFRNSDGKLAEAPGTASVERFHRLRSTKIKVLEIAWNYLYGGRAAEAWNALEQMWPASDVERIHAALVSVRAQGIHKQVDVTTTEVPARHKRAQIFDATSIAVAKPNSDLIPPRAILLELPPGFRAEEASASTQHLLLDLVIDAAGKVRSVQAAGEVRSLTPVLAATAMTWKFIPAFRSGRPVASRLRIAVSPKE